VEAKSKDMDFEEPFLSRGRYQRIYQKGHQIPVERRDFLDDVLALHLASGKMGTFQLQTQINLNF
jgi:hypothetical protein